MQRVWDGALTERHLHTGHFIRHTCTVIQYNTIQQLCLKFYIYKAFTLSGFVVIVRNVIILLYVFYLGHSG